MIPAPVRVARNTRIVAGRNVFWKKGVGEERGRRYTRTIRNNYITQPNIF